MKKHLLTIAAAFLTLGAMAQNEVRLTFSRTGTDAGSVTVNVVDENGNAIDGASATITGLSHSFKATAGNVTESILCPNVNANTDPTININFTLNGISNFTVENAGLHIHALNGQSNYQSSSDNVVRQWNVETVIGENIFGSLANIDIAAGIDGVNKMWDIEVAEGNTITINGETVIALTITKGTTNNGCFFGLSEIRLVRAEEVVEQEVPFLTQVTAGDLMAKTEATNIAIKNLSYTNNRWFVGNTGAVPYSAEDFTNDAIFVWEPVEAGVAGSYYLKKGDTYMQTTSPKDFGTVENAAVFTAVAPGTNGTFNGDGDSNLYITGSTDANLVRFVKGNNWINVQNGANGTPTYNTGTGGWTIHYVYEVTEVLSFKANITAAGFATFFTPAEVTIPENVNAYYIAADGINDNSVTLTQIENVIPANTAVILEGAEGEYTFSVSETDAAAVSGNLLKGTAINTNIIGDAYVLGVVEGETGLYKAQMSTVALSSASGSVKVFLNNAYKAYLPASALPAALQGAANFSFRFGEGTTGISEVKGENGEVKAIFDLTGRRVESITAPGIYIVNGKKVLVK